MEEDREAGRLLMEREKYRTKNGPMQNTSTDSKRLTFVILKNHTSAPIRKERLSPMKKARMEASRNEFVEKGVVPKSKAFEKLIEDFPKTQPGFVKPI